MPHRSTLIVICILITATVNAADTLFVSLNLNSIKDYTLHVKIKTPQPSFHTQRFFMPANVPGTISEITTGRLVSNFTALDKQGKALTVNRNSVNEFEITNATALASIEYDVHDTWHYVDSLITLPQIGTDFRPATHCLLNFSTMLGYMEGFERTVWVLNITRPDGLKLHTTMAKRVEGAQDIFTANGYLGLIDNPVMYSKNEPYTFTVGGTRFRMGLYSENDSLKVVDVLKVLKPVCEGVNAFCNGLSTKEFYFIFNFVSRETDRQPSEENYGAIQHSNCSVFYFPESNDKYKTSRLIQYTASHELFHVFEPLNFKTDATSKLNMRSKTETANIWFYEGITEYFSLLMQLRYELISQQEFITEVRNKMNLMNYYEPFSLVTSSSRAHLPGNENIYRNFYYKGAVVAMMMDLKLLSVSNGGMNLQDLLIRMRRDAKENYVIEDGEVVEELIKLSFPEMREFFKDYVEGDKKIDYNDFLPTIGWVYEEHRTDTTLLYANANYRYNKQTDEIVMTRITLNQVGFKEGDVLLRINGKKVTKDNVDAMLEEITDLDYRETVQFIVKRGNKEVLLTGEPLTVSKEQKDVITVDKKPTKQKRSMEKIYRRGNIDINKRPPTK
jgi:predicted metalloprotease with PDZ domain